MPTWWQRLWAFVQTADFLAQSAHFFSAWAVTITAANYLPWWGAALGFLAYTSFKELIFDAWVGGKRVVSSRIDQIPEMTARGENHGTPDWLDWFVNIVGIGVGATFALV